MQHRCPAPYKVRDMCGTSPAHVRNILTFIDTLPRFWTQLYQRKRCSKGAKGMRVSLFAKKKATANRAQKQTKLTERTLFQKVKTGDKIHHQEGTPRSVVP